MDVMENSEVGRVVTMMGSPFAAKVAQCQRRFHLCMVCIFRAGAQRCAPFD